MTYLICVAENAANPLQCAGNWLLQIAKHRRRRRRCNQRNVPSQKPSTSVNVLVDYLGPLLQWSGQRKSQREYLCPPAKGRA
jgi:hypothetical protein